jgi:hypothetical protein
MIWIFFVSQKYCSEWYFQLIFFARLLLSHRPIGADFQTAVQTDAMRAQQMQAQGMSLPAVIGQPAGQQQPQMQQQMQMGQPQYQPPNLQQFGQPQQQQQFQQPMYANPQQQQFQQPMYANQAQQQPMYANQAPPQMGAPGATQDHPPGY